MNISPVSFKGMITVKTKIDDDTVKTEHFHTTKKEDAAILKAYEKNQEYIQEYQKETCFNFRSRDYGNLDNIYAEQTKHFHTTLENIIKKPIQQPDNGFKILAMGMYYPINDARAKYDSSYNKITYRDEALYGVKALPQSTVTVDFMEPEERRAGAEKALKNIKEVLSKYTGATEKLLPDTLKPDLDTDKSARQEEVLNKVLKNLEGYGIYADSKYYPKFGSPQNTYLALVQKLREFTEADLLTRFDAVQPLKVSNVTKEDEIFMQSAIQVFNIALQEE